MTGIADRKEERRRGRGGGGVKDGGRGDQEGEKNAPNTYAYGIPINEHTRLPVESLPREKSSCMRHLQRKQINQNSPGPLLSPRLGDESSVQNLSSSKSSWSLIQNQSACTRTCASCYRGQVSFSVFISFVLSALVKQACGTNHREGQKAFVCTINL